MIQKLLGTLPPGSAASLFTTLFAMDGAGSATHASSGAAFHAQQQAKLVRRLPASLPLHAYSGPALGVMLAGHVLVRQGGGSTGADQDQQAVLGFVCRRAQPAADDLAALYALDILCCVAITRSSAHESVELSPQGQSEKGDNILPQLAKLVDKAVLAFGLTLR